MLTEAYLAAFVILIIGAIALVIWSVTRPSAQEAKLVELGRLKDEAIHQQLLWEQRFDEERVKLWRARVHYYHDQIMRLLRDE